MIFVRPAFWLGRLFWKGGDGAIIDRFGPDGVAARVVDVTGRVVKLQTGYIYHYAFAMLDRRRRAHHLVSGRGSALMFGFGILSCIVFLPLVGAGFILALRGEDEATLNNARWAALATTLIVFLLSLVRLRQVRFLLGGIPARRGETWFGSGLVYKTRRRRHVDALRASDRLPDAVLHRRVVEIDHLSGQGIYDRLPRARDADARRLLARSISCCSISSSRAASFRCSSSSASGAASGASTRASNSSSTRWSARCLMLLAIMAMYGVAGTTDIIGAC